MFCDGVCRDTTCTVGYPTCRVPKRKTVNKQLGLIIVLIPHLLLFTYERVILKFSDVYI